MKPWEGSGGWDFSTWNQSNSQGLDPTFSSFGNEAVISVVHPCESTYGPYRLAYTLERTACAAPDPLHPPASAVAEVCRTATELCLAVPFLCLFIYILIHIQTPSTCTQIQVYVDLQPNFTQNYVRMKRFVNSEVLIKAVRYLSYQIYNLQCTWPDM